MYIGTTNGAVGIYKKETAPPGGYAKATTGRCVFSEKAGAVSYSG